MLSLRWLGVAGIELICKGKVLLVDPYVTRIPFWAQWVGKIEPNRKLVQSSLPYAQYVLVTHAHYDHLLDVSEILTKTGALALGSANTCQLLKCLGTPAAQIRQINSGETIDLGHFQVEVLPAQHAWAPGFGSGLLRSGLKPPLAARDYRLDACYSYLIKVDGLRLLVASGKMQNQAPQADVLFTNPLYAEAGDSQFLDKVQPVLLIPVHWDDFWRPLSEIQRPMWQPPRWGLPLFKRFSLHQFRQTILKTTPGVQLRVLERFQLYFLQRLADERVGLITQVDQSTFTSV